MAFFSFEVIHDLIQTDNYNFRIGEAFFVAFLTNLYILGAFAFVGFVLPTSKLLPNSYYHTKQEKQLKSTYNVLGVHYFRYLLLFFFWGSKKNRKKYFDGTRSGLKNFIYQSHQSEFGHLGGFVFVVLASLIMVMKHYWWMALFTLGINVIGNLYPIILQRYHRIRIERVI